MERIVPRLYVTLEDLQADNQSIIIEVEGNIYKQYISIFIDLGSTHRYISPKIVEMCEFNKTKHSKSWLVQLATKTKRKVSEMVEKCPFEKLALHLVKYKYISTWFL